MYFKSFYDSLAHWDTPRNPNITKKQLQLYRTLLLVVNFMMLAACIATNEFVWYFYYLTFWGYNVTWISILASIKAANYS